MLVGNGTAKLLQTLIHHLCQPVYALCTAAQSIWPVIDPVKSSNNAQQHLGRTDIGGCSFSTNVLFASLQSHSIHRVFIRILCYPNNTSRYFTFIFFSGSKV